MKECGLKKEDGTDIDDSLLRPVLTKCGKVLIDLAKELTEHESKVEQMVSSPIQAVLESDIPAILKTKRTLSKLVLDKDSANNRYQVYKLNKSHFDTLFIILSVSKTSKVSLKVIKIFHIQYTIE